MGRKKSLTERAWNSGTWPAKEGALLAKIAQLQTENKQQADFLSLANFTLEQMDAYQAKLDKLEEEIKALHEELMAQAKQFHSKQYCKCNWCAMVKKQALQDTNKDGKDK